MNDFTREIEYLKGIVGKYFSIYDVRMRPEAISFFCKVNMLTVSDNFDRLRKEMIPKRYIPVLTKEDANYVIHVQKRPQVKYMGVRVNVIMLILTLFTTILAGMWNWAGYEGIDPMSYRSFLFGTLFFTIPLLAILSTHEFGHYFMAKKYSVNASLPFFVPSFPPLGTFGAVISMRDPIPDRKALIDIGIAGPISGLLVAIPVTILGLFLMASGGRPVPPNIGGSAIQYFTPFLFQFFSLFIPVSENVLFHPTAFAGWVGLFVTALNLLPAGQLDGGHVARALMGEKSKYLSIAAVLIMFFFSFFYQGWIILALLIIFLGVKHPPPLNDITKLTPRRKLVGLVAALILVLCFVPIPMEEIPARPNFAFSSFAPPVEFITNVSLEISPGGSESFSFLVNNTGNTFGNISLFLGEASSSLKLYGWNITFTALREITFYSSNVTILLNSTEYAKVTILIGVPSDVPSGKTFPVDIIGKMVKGPEKRLTLNINV